MPTIVEFFERRGQSCPDGWREVPFVSQLRQSKACVRGRRSAIESIVKGDAFGPDRPDRTLGAHLPDGSTAPARRIAPPSNSGGSGGKRSGLGFLDQLARSPAVWAVGAVVAIGAASLGGRDE